MAQEEKNSADTKNNTGKNILISLILLAIVAFGIFGFYYSREQQNKKLYYLETFNQIEDLQAQYWEIIKRNDLLLYQNKEENGKIKKDKEDLSKLYKTVENNINENLGYYRRLNNTERQYFENTDAQVPYDAIHFAQCYNDAVNDVLNITYKEVKGFLPKNDYAYLKASEKQWLKDVKNYKILMDEKDLGDLGSMTKAYAIADIRKFRILLLTSYYRQKHILKSQKIS